LPLARFFRPLRSTPPTDDDFAAAVGRTWTDDRPSRLLTDLTELNRMAGHPGERRAIDRAWEALADAGVADIRTTGQNYSNELATRRRVRLQ